MKIIHEKCEKVKSDDKKLPSDSFLVTYKEKDEIKYDIARAGSVNEIFDHYYDKYKNVQGIAWTNGIVSPRSFGNQPILEEKPKRKRKK